MSFRAAFSFALLLAVLPWQASLAQPTTMNMDCPLIVASAVIAGNAELVLLDPARGELLNVTNTPGDDLAPAWSPDGRTLAFAAQREGNWDIYSYSLASGRVQRLTSAPWYEGFPSFSPDGRQIAYEAHAEGDLDIYVMPVRGGAAQLVVSGRGADSEPQWVGRDRLLYTTWRDEERLLALHSLAEGSTTLLSAPHEQPAQAAISPDGQQVAYVSTGDATTRLRLRNLAGERSTAQVTRHSAWPFWSAGGHLMSLELTGGGDYAYPTGWTLSQRTTPGKAPVPLLEPTLPGLGWQRPSCAPPGTARPAGAWTSLAKLPPQLALPVQSRAGTTIPRGVSEVTDIDAPSSLFATAVVGSFTRLRTQVQRQLGYDFLYRFGDTWRSIGNMNGDLASWHKTGRAFDVPHAFNAGGVRRLYLAREVLGNQTYFRLYLLAKIQDGSVGAPMRESVFEVLGRQNDPRVVREGGYALPPPSGYFVDLTELAEREGWNRIPGLTAPDGDWRKHYNDIEYWHYERRDGFSWYDAMALVHPPTRLTEWVTRAKLREGGYTTELIDQLGVPK